MLQCMYTHIEMKCRLFGLERQQMHQELSIGEVNIEEESTAQIGQYLLAVNVTNPKPSKT